ncbi:hypothetical protein A2U01_0049494, partial [Trifolium medium]|nr:hypothetical protein [Trifolium medium]
CNEVEGKEEVIALTEFVTTEKHEENPKDKENGGEEARIKGSEPEEEMLLFQSRCNFTFDAIWTLNETASAVHKGKELVVVRKPPPDPPDASPPATTLPRRAPLPPEPPDVGARVVTVLPPPQPPDTGSHGVSSPLATTLLRQVPPLKPPDLGDFGNGKGNQKMEEYLHVI